MPSTKHKLHSLYKISKYKEKLMRFPNLKYYRIFQEIEEKLFHEQYNEKFYSKTIEEELTKRIEEFNKLLNISIKNLLLEKYSQGHFNSNVYNEFRKTDDEFSIYYNPIFEIILNFNADEALLTYRSQFKISKEEFCSHEDLIWKFVNNPNELLEEIEDNFISNY